MIRAKVIADSVNPDGNRLTTYEATFNRWILAELNTHRVLSRNSASSRAIPVSRIMRQVWSDPAYPMSWGSNKAGMQAGGELRGVRRWLASRLFRWARLPAIATAWFLSKVGLHKQVVNRILEPWVWHTAIVSGTEWDNFFKLRDHKDAQPEFQVLAKEMRIARDLSTPVRLEWGDWHLPYVDRAESFAIAASVDGDDVWRTGPAMVSAACCARVSYVRQSSRKSLEEDLAFTNRLMDSGHWSPTEHPALAERGSWGNFTGFRQLRKFYQGEDGRS